MKAAQIYPQAVLTVAEMYAADAAAVQAGVTSLALMEAAGIAVVREISKRWPVQEVLILCGPGNNGGDGFVVARHLFALGWPVCVAIFGDIASLKGDSATNAARWCAIGKMLENIDGSSVDELLSPRPLVVDAMFGAGLSRGLSGTAAYAVQQISNRRLTTIAIDVPSGVHGDTGVVLPSAEQPAKSGVAVACALTVTFFRLKPAHVLYPGRALCGDVVVADIGIPSTVLSEIKPGGVVVNDPSLWTLPQPDWQSHKYTRGHVLAFGGVDTGAIRLAGHALRRVGAGLLTYAVPASSAGIYAAGQPGAMVRSVDSTADLDAVLSDHRKNVALIGPGFGVGPATCNLVLRLLNTSRAVVIDADALTSFSPDPQLLFEAISARSAPTVMTPHEGEFARLFGSKKGSKLSRAKAAAALSSAVVVLKGPDTLVAAPDGRVAINTNGSSWLATGGSGDVLAGLVAGLLAQDMSPWSAACAAVWLHGAAGTKSGPGLIAEDLPNAVNEVIKTLYLQYDND